MENCPGVLSGGLWVDGPTSTLLCEVMRLATREAHRNGARLDPRLIALAKAADTVARQWKAGVAERPRNTGTPHGDTPASIGLVRSADAARVLGIGTRAVRGLAERGTLPGYKDGNGWRFVLADVVHLADQREERMHA